jgi:uncharacterized protein YhbP (UPF0306 family)
MSQPSPTSESPAEIAHRIIEENSYMTLATADESGRPWATPVWFAHSAADGDEFVWVSRPGTRHSENIGARPEVAIVVYDSSVPVGSAAAVYVVAVAHEVTDDERPAALAVFNDGGVADGIPAWNEADVSGPAQFRMYRARATAVFVLGEGDQRVPLA